MPTIVISYRRSDTSVIAGRIFDHLTAHYGKDAVFIDIDNIPYGIDFRDHIRETLQHTDVLIALIGANWLGRNAAGGTRMEEPTDPVRLEIETALQQKVRIIPTLIDGAKMPDSAELPPTFGNFAYLNAADVSSGRDFAFHMGRLIAAIDKAMAPPGALEAKTVEPPPAETAVPGRNWRVDVLRYFVVPLVVLLIIHYAVVNSFNLNTDYLRLGSVLVPLVAGFALYWFGDYGGVTAIAFALALGLVGVTGMTVSESLYTGDPMMPQSRFEWLDNFQFAALIALSFVAGYLIAGAARMLVRRIGKT